MHGETDGLSAGSSTQAHTSQPPNDGCHFCGETGHTMVHGNCAKLESFISQGKICRNHEGKVILPSGTMIPNYAGKQLYMERVDEWHQLNPNQPITGRLSASANPDEE